MTEPNHDKILIVDFGSQVTQLIARRVREQGVYCDIVPYDRAAAAAEADPPRAIILSGGPASLTEEEAPRADPRLFRQKVPLLGICYGFQALCQQLGGEVETSGEREFG